MITSLSTFCVPSLNNLFYGDTLFIATYICWETDLNKSSRLLSESQFINSVIGCMYALLCTHVKSLSNKICLN